MEEKRFFVCVGAQKAGTTWLYEILKLHGEVWVPPIKEMHYFDEKYIGEGHYSARLNSLITAAQRQLLIREQNRPYTRMLLEKESEDLIRLAEFFSIYDDVTYYNYFIRKSGEKKIVGEITPEYALLPKEGFTNIINVFPGVIFIFIMRDPINRYWSQIKMESAMYGMPIDDFIEQNNLLDPHLGIPLRSDYMRTIKNMECAGINISDVKIFFYEELLLGDTNFELSKLFYELGLGGELNERVRNLTNRVVFGGQEVPLPEDRLEGLRRRFDPVYKFVEAQWPNSIKTWEHY